MQYRKMKKGEQISILGYECMRFSKKAAALIWRRPRVRLWRQLRQVTCALPALPKRCGYTRDFLML